MRQGTSVEEQIRQFVSEEVTTIDEHTDDGMPYMQISSYIRDEVQKTRKLRTAFIKQARSYVQASSLNHGEVMLSVGEINSTVEHGAVDSTPWLKLTWNLLDITCIKAWRNILGYPGDHAIRVIRAEHVLEHLTIAEAVVALKLMKQYLAPGGKVRLAVPDYNALLYGEWEPQANREGLRRAVRRRTKDTRTDQEGGFGFSWPGGATPHCRGRLCARTEALLQSGALHQDLVDGHHVQYTDVGLRALLESVGLSANMLEWTDGAGVVQGPCKEGDGKGHSWLACEEWQPRQGIISRSSRGSGGRAVSLVVDGSVPWEDPVGLDQMSNNDGDGDGDGDGADGADTSTHTRVRTQSVILDLRPVEFRTCEEDATACEVLRGVLPVVMKHLAFTRTPLEVLTSNPALAEAAGLPAPPAVCGMAAAAECDDTGGTWAVSGLGPTFDEVQRLMRMFADVATIVLRDPVSEDVGLTDLGVHFTPVLSNGTHGNSSYNQHLSPPLRHPSTDSGT
jgi:hypothetical protein